MKSSPDVFKSLCRNNNIDLKCTVIGCAKHVHRSLDVLARSITSLNCVLLGIIAEKGILKVQYLIIMKYVSSPVLHSLDCLLYAYSDIDYDLMI